MLTFADHGTDSTGQDGTGEPLWMLLRKGNAGSNTAVDHITVLKAAFAQLPGFRRGRRVGRSVLVRADGAGCTHQLLDWLARQRVQYLVGFTLPDDFAVQLRRLDRSGVWQPAYDADGQIRDGAFVAEATGLLDLSSWPAGMRVIVRKERPHPGAQLRITDVDGNRVTAFATNTSIGGPGMQLADLELRHRRRARCEDRIRLAKDTGLHSHLAYRKGHRYKPTSARSRDVCATAVVISSPNSGVSNVADRPFRIGRRHVI